MFDPKVGQGISCMSGTPRVALWAADPGVEQEQRSAAHLAQGRDVGLGGGAGRAAVRDLVRDGGCKRFQAAVGVGVCGGRLDL
jgi:hypothetical protein